MFQRSAWSAANFEVELRAHWKPWKKQEGVQGKKCLRVKNTLKSLALTVDHQVTNGMAQCPVSNTGPVPDYHGVV